MSEAIKPILGEKGWGPMANLPDKHPCFTDCVENQRTG